MRTAGNLESNYVVEHSEVRPRTRFALFGAGFLAWAFALVCTRDVDIHALLASVPAPWHGLLAAPFDAPLLPFCLALSAGLGMVMLVSEAPKRLKVYGALLAFTAPMYAAARLLA